MGAQAERQVLQNLGQGMSGAEIDASITRHGGETAIVCANTLRSNLEVNYILHTQTKSRRASRQMRGAARTLPPNDTCARREKISKRARSISSRMRA